jgi:glycosyltransferase involved in cell wall biosynthesis
VTARSRCFPDPSRHVADEFMSQEHPLVSVVVMGYRRPELLARTLHSLLETVSYPRIETILCDDGSPHQEQAQMQRLPFDRFLLAEENGGLGRNANQGIQAAGGEYILHLQDDWLCRGPADFIEAAVSVMEERADVGMVRFRPLAGDAPHERYQTQGGLTVRIYEPGIFARTGLYAYTDNPHLKAGRFHELLGLYRERVSMTAMELDFARRVDEQARLRVAHVAGHDVFEHIGAEQSFNPSVRRSALKTRLLANPATKWPFQLYLKLRHRKERHVSGR